LRRFKVKNLRDFMCEKCGTVQERFLDGEIVEVACHCGELAKRVIGMPRVALDGTDPGFPGAYEKWARVREENRAILAKKSYVGE
jgi:hypothetical protein